MHGSRLMGGRFTKGLVLTVSCLLLSCPWFACQCFADVIIQDRHCDVPLVLDQPTGYVLRNVEVAGVTDAAALTLAGRVESVSIEHGRFGNVRSGSAGRAAALDVAGATVGSFTATDTAFYDAENQLVSMKDGSFGTVSFLHCTFKVSDRFLRKLYADNPWRTLPPTTEFYNIERLELLDNEYANTTIVIHPSVKMVIFRGDISRLRVESSSTQVIRLAPGADADEVTPRQRLAGANGGTGTDETPVLADANP